MRACNCGLRRVFVVDDDDAIRERLAELIVEEGCDVSTAGDGASALNHLRRHHACLVFLDLMMPGVSGWQVLATMLADDDLAEIPVCIITAVETHAPIGTVAVLAKPLNLDRLLDVIRRYGGMADRDEPAPR
jgi:adenylate cyclase